MPDALTHPTPAELAAFGLGKLEGDAATTVANHLAACETCHDAVAKLPGDSFVNLVKAARPNDEPTRSYAGTPLPTDTLQGAPPPSLAGLPPELAAHPKFRIVRELGRGGMGIVYHAEHRLMERPVAIKVINKNLLDHPGALERFHREVKAAAQLTHANIVIAHDAETAGDLHLLVMEYVAGTDLARVAAKHNRLPVRHACAYARQAALGLQHAFEKGMVHRDIKPQNLMLTPEGRVKILDFGLARMVSEQKHGHELTEQNAMMGTPAYMAPEQGSDAHTADIRADIYSLGCTLYCLLTGEPPFAGGSAMHVIFAHKHLQAKPLHEVNPQVPPELSAVVAKMMAKEPDQRYQKPSEVAQALAPFCKPATNNEVTVAPKGAPAARAKPQTLPSTVDHAALAALNQVIADVAVKPGKTKRKPFVLMAAATIVLAALIGLLASGVFKVKTPHGIIVLEDLPADAEVLVDGASVTVTWSDGGKKAEILVKPGTRNIVATKDGVSVLGESVEIEDGGRRILTARIDRPALPESGKPAPTFTNSLGMEFVLVPKGRSWLGGGGGRPGDKEVVIAHDFYLGKYEVTQAEWEQVTGINPSYFSRTGDGKKTVKDIADAELKRFPVENVSWDDAQAFLERLNKGEQHEGWIYRLPKEAEWEYACRGGPTSDRFDCWFDFYCDKPTNQLLRVQANFEDGKGLKRTCKVGSYPSNRLGLYDMHGNVAEWCDDAAQAAAKPSLRVLKGGCWWNDAKADRAAGRYAHPPSRRDFGLGLRVARVPVSKNTEEDTTSAAAPENSEWAGVGTVERQGNRQIKAMTITITERRGRAFKASVRGGAVQLLIEGTVEDGGAMTHRVAQVIASANAPRDKMTGSGEVSKDRMTLLFKNPDTDDTFRYELKRLPDAGARFNFVGRWRSPDGQAPSGYRARTVHDDKTFLDWNGGRYTWSRDGGLIHLEWPLGHEWLAIDPDNPDELNGSSTWNRQVGARWIREKGPSPTQTKPVMVPPKVNRLAVSNDRGKWRVEGEELVQDTLDGDVRLYFGDPNWTDYDFTCEAMSKQGMPCFSQVFRSPSIETGYYFTLGHAHNVAIALERFDGRVIYPQALRQHQVENDKWYKLCVKVRGEKVQCLVDGNSEHDATWPMPAKGMAGLRTWETVARFRGIRITAPDGRILWEGLPELNAPGPPK